MRTAAHFQQLQCVAVICHQDFERGIIHRGVIDLQRGQGFGVDKNYCQRRDEMRLLKREKRKEH